MVNYIHSQYSKGATDAQPPSAGSDTLARWNAEVRSRPAGGQLTVHNMASLLVEAAGSGKSAGEGAERVQRT